MYPIKKYSLLIAILFLAACSDDDNGNSLSVEEQQLEELKSTIANYHDHTTAIEAGWNTDISGCVEHPEFGGMGHHYAKMEYMDGRVNHLEPQVLLYMVNQQHEMEFLGVEYIVPFDILGPESTPPSLFNREFHQNHEQQIWALHVWTEKENTNGMFEDWNPEVTCAFWVEKLLDEVRTTTSSYSNFDTATASGWDSDISGCVEHPDLGGMGHHYANMEYMDGRTNYLEPQVLLFTPDENETMEFLGVEYIVPFEIHPEDEEPPMLFNQPYHQNHEQEIWALHVWTEKENPNGIFEDWNPNVSCN